MAQVHCYACGRECAQSEKWLAHGVGLCCDYATGRDCARFNRWVERMTREALEDGVACCGNASRTEGDEHDDDCSAAPTRDIAA